MINLTNGMSGATMAAEVAKSLDKYGDTMLGKLLLEGDMTESKQAIKKKYIDDCSGGEISFTLNLTSLTNISVPLNRAYNKIHLVLSDGYKDGGGLDVILLDNTTDIVGSVYTKDLRTDITTTSFLYRSQGDTPAISVSPLYTGPAYDARGYLLHTVNDNNSNGNYYYDMVLHHVYYNNGTPVDPTPRIYIVGKNYPYYNNGGTNGNNVKITGYWMGYN